MDWKIKFIFFLIVILILFNIFSYIINQIENIFNTKIDFIPEGELIHSEGYTFPPEADLERGSASLFF